MTYSKNNFDFDAADTCYFVDPVYHMMLEMNYNWNPTGDSGRGDSIGRTFEAYYAYRDERFVDAVKNCWVRIEDDGGYFYQGYRFPTHVDSDMSRDHLFNTVLMLIASGHSKEYIKEFVTHVQWKISGRYSQTLDLWLWMRAVSGIWWAKILSPIVDIPILAINVLWQKIIYEITPFSEELSQEEFCSISNYKKTNRMKKMGAMLFPSYTITQYAWKLHYMESSLSKKILKWLLLKISNKHNYVVRLLLEDKNKPTKEQVYSYKPMMGGRWDGILNPEINDRDMHLITTEKYPNCDKLLGANVLDVDLLRSVYENSKY